MAGVAANAAERGEVVFELGACGMDGATVTGTTEADGVVDVGIGAAVARRGFEPSESSL